MKVKVLKVKKSMLLSAFIKANLLGAGFIFIRNILKNKDVKINGVRTSADAMLNVGDEVQLFYKDDAIKKWKPYHIVWEDNNVAIVFKNRGIETSSNESENTLEKLLGYDAVHRLDVNTEGLVIFAKNKTAKDELKTAFENGLIKKTYLALCFGELKKSPVTLVGYLLKNKDIGEVSIMKEKQPGALPIKTVVEFVRKRGDFSVIKINPLTGRTHQIRAHLASIGLHIVGDGKYGKASMNKIYNQDKQCLSATEIKFAFSQGSVLYYLNDREFTAKPTFL